MIVICAITGIIKILNCSDLTSFIFLFNCTLISLFKNKRIDAWVGDTKKVEILKFFRYEL